MMILPDVNVLVHAYNQDSMHHARARAWWEETLTQGTPLVMPWAVLCGYVRLMTNSRTLIFPITVEAAEKDVRGWIALPQLTIIEPGEKHADLFFTLLRSAGTGGNLTSDAHLAALAMEYRAEVATCDTDFARFKGVRWFDPLDHSPRRGK
jgi:toxin-antitoxin system PIN domain toxin